MAKIVVYHRGLGCDTGCCGHVVALTRDNDVIEENFRFTHPYGQDAQKFAEELVTQEFGAEHVADLDWENSDIYDDEY